MARPSSPITAWAQYLGARLAAMGLTMFDVETNERSAAALGRALYRFDRRHRERACGHIAMAFPQWDEAKVDRVARASFEHFMQLAVEVLHTPRVLHEDSWAERIRIRNLGPAIDLLNAGQPVILLTGHLGNWEVLGYLLALLGYDIDALARPIDNPLINRWLLGIREARGMRIITKWDATQRMIEVLEGGGALGFIADQNAGDKGMFVPFFGKLASTYKSIGLLAMNLEVPVVCGYAHRLGRRYAYEVGSADVIRPEEWADQPDPLFYITARYIRAIETMIRMRPEQYLWMHRRWKSRPRHERQGKPIPRTLRRRLESLPWMDETQLEQLEAARDKPGSPVIMQA
ncbi:MAG: lysophospholipid acyltransferase family protein [Phycisphaeraceae bacterium]